MKAKKISYIWIAPPITLAIMLVLFAAAGIYPFGTATTAVVDGVGQYLPFLSEFSQKIHEGGSLLFSWNAGRGVNFWVDIGYYLASPLNLIALFFKPTDIDNAFALLTLIKPALMALTFGIYLKYAYKKDDFSVAIFSVLWSFSAFLIGGISFTSWMDSLIYFPLVILGLKRLMDGKSAILYSLFLGLSIISNFYIGWIICIFCIIYFIYSFIADDEVGYERAGLTSESEDEKNDDGVNIFAVFSQSYLLKTFFKFILSSIVAGALSAVFALPTLTALQNTSKGTTETAILNVHDFWGILASHILPLKNVYRTLVSSDVLFAFAGIVTVILAVAYFFTKGISKRKKVANFFMLAVMWVSIAFFAVTTIWHGFGVPAGIMYRFGFVYSFVLLKIAYEAFANIKSIPIYGIISGGVFALICAAGIHFSEIFSIMYSAKTIAVVCAFAVCFVVILLLLSKKPKLKNVMTAVLAVTVIAETVVLNFGNIGSIDLTTLLNEYNAAQKAAEHLGDGEYMHFEKNDKTFDNIVSYGMLFGYNGSEYYSSMADSDFVGTMNFLGLNGNNINSENGPQEQTPMFNMLFPTKYYLDGSGNLSDSYFRKKIDSYDGYNLYKMNYTMPFMYTVSNDIREWDPFEFLLATDNQNAAANALTGTKEDIISYNENGEFSYVNCKSKTMGEILAENAAKDGHEYEGGYNALFDYLQSRMSDMSYEIEDVNKPAQVSFTTTAQNDGLMYIFISTSEFTDVNIKVNGREYNYFAYGVGNGRMYELGDVKKGDTAEITIGGYKKDGVDEGKVYSAKYEKLSACSFTVDKEKLDKAYNKLDAMSDTEMLEFEDTYVKAKVTSYEEGILYIPTAYDEGWTILIDGEETPLYEHESHILMTEIGAGEHTIEMKYMPVGLIPGAVITGVSVIILVAWAVISINRFKKERNSGTISVNDVNEE